MCCFFSLYLIYFKYSNFYTPLSINTTVTIEGTKNATGVRKLQGFFIQGDVTKASFAGDITCGADGHNVTYCGKTGAGNTNDSPKEKVVCKWTPPDFQMGTLQFV